MCASPMILAVIVAMAVSSLSCMPREMEVYMALNGMEKHHPDVECGNTKRCALALFAVIFVFEQIKMYMRNMRISTEQSE